jgi:antitoxin HicB
MQFLYPITIEEDRSGPPETYGLLVTFPDLPEAITSGKDMAEVRINASDCLEEALAGRIVDREEIPPPSPARGRPVVGPGSLIGAKAALYLAMRELGVSQSELARRIGVAPPLVNRLLDPRHASRADRLDAAFAALGKRLIIAVEAAA